MAKRALDSIARAAREPALQLTALGLGLFLAHGWIAPEGDDREIEISEAVVEGLRLEFQRRMGREPTAEELRGEVESLVDEEVLYREAVALGLDRGDRVVRRRMVQKMELLFEDTTLPEEPDDEELEAYLAAHRERYQRPGTLSFEQVYVRGGEGSAERAEALLSGLRRGVASGDVGDPFPLGSTLSARTLRQVEDGFGAEMASRLASAPEGEWVGPFSSRFGHHVVRVTARMAATDPGLAEIRERVRGDLRRERVERANRASVESLRAGYRINVRYPDWLDAPAGEGEPERQALALAGGVRP